MNAHSITPEVQSFLKERLSFYTKMDQDKIAQDADLISLGLQSIDAVLISGEIEDHFKIELDPSTVFEHDTFESFAAEITRRLNAK
ncbi:acyl carrier protein [Roseibium suaedae]|uniref:Phosphopantetheine attachment site n=1 Tax=Roseibium suaedae TaxID=735517 RepID=A0A1M7P564_9HYPH|nr:acyl carrier protein [Roseibium suaedae]SHN11708.1 Phosphopantetheine attachment site [Roseibium suaedae]